jgi:hypothetical protein
MKALVLLACQICSMILPVLLASSSLVVVPGEAFTFTVTSSFVSGTSRPLRHNHNGHERILASGQDCDRIGRPVPLNKRARATRTRVKDTIPSGSGDLDNLPSFENLAAAFDAAASTAASFTLTKKKKDINPKNNNKTSSPRLRDEGLSRFHQSLLTPERQIFVTGKFPLFVSVQDSPTRRWLSMRRRRNRGEANSLRPMATSQVYINGTTLDRSLASYDRLSWLDDEEVDTMSTVAQGSDCYTLELLAEISTRNPGYLNILPREAGGIHHQTEISSLALSNMFQMHKRQNLFRTSTIEGGGVNEDEDRAKRREDILWSSHFSIARKGGLTTVDTITGNMRRMSAAFTWPNEMTSVPRTSTASRSLPHSQVAHTTQNNDDALLVSDGFLVPGRDNGGVYVVVKPGQLGERKVQLAGGNSEWFYHK